MTKLLFFCPWSLQHVADCIRLLKKEKARYELGSKAITWMGAKAPKD